MRRKDREIQDFDAIVDILQRADTIRLGLHGEAYPYVVPLSFGMQAEHGRITLYVHGAAEGLKHDLLAKNANVCVEADILHRYVELPGSAGAAYESVIGFGKAQRVTGKEAAKGLALLMAHCGFAGKEWDNSLESITAVYRIELESFTGKRCTF